MSRQLKNQCDVAANLIWQAIKLLEAVELTDEIDQQAMKKLITDLAWANENASVIGRHLIGENLDDTMGYTRR